MELKKLQGLYVRNIYFGNSSGKPRLIPDLSEFLCGLPAKKKNLGGNPDSPAATFSTTPFFGPCQHSLALNELAASSGGSWHLNGKCVRKGGDLYRICSMSLFGGLQNDGSRSVLGMFKGDMRGVPQYVKSYFILFRMFGLDSGNLTR